MKIQLENATHGQYQIRSYGPGKIIINQETHRRSVIVTPNRIIADWSPQKFSELKSDDFAAITELLPEIIILGTGRHSRFPQSALLKPLIKAQIGFEVMNTGAACRTYNVLMGEGRRVVAAMFMIEE